MNTPLVDTHILVSMMSYVREEPELFGDTPELSTRLIPGSTPAQGSSPTSSDALRRQRTPSAKQMPSRA